MKVIGVIPARLYSSRFPKKILHLIDGKPMVVHVYEQALKAKSLDDVIVAIDADDQGIAFEIYFTTSSTDFGTINATADIADNTAIFAPGKEPVIEIAIKSFSFNWISWNISTTNAAKFGC